MGESEQALSSQVIASFSSTHWLSAVEKSVCFSVCLLKQLVPQSNLLSCVLVIPPLILNARSCCRSLLVGDCRRSVCQVEGCENPTSRLKCPKLDRETKKLKLSISQYSLFPSVVLLQIYKNPWILRWSSHWKTCGYWPFLRLFPSLKWVAKRTTARIVNRLLATAAWNVMLSSKHAAANNRILFLWGVSDRLQYWTAGIYRHQTFCQD